MIDFKNGTCRTCKFVYWDGDMEEDGETQSAECCRFPPIFIRESSLVNSIDGWKHPRVEPDTTVCGEYA